MSRAWQSRIQRLVDWRATCEKEIDEIMILTGRSAESVMQEARENCEEGGFLEYLEFIKEQAKNPNRGIE
jgi:tRNA G37 N-methylase Trm5